MSKTVDDRIVSMSFDNSKFDKNVQKSIETIKQLKSNLKFDKNTNPFGELNESAKKVDLSGIEKSLDSIKHRFSTTGIIGMTVISNLTTAAMNMAKKSTHWFTQGVVQGGMARAKNIEQAKFQLKGLKIEWDSIKGDIDYAVDGTAYGLDAAAKAASQLVASGVQIGDDMKAALRGISGVAAMTNSSYEDISRIFTTVAGNGRLMGEQLNQLSSRGLNVAAKLAEARGISEQELRQLVSAGKISFAEFSKAMDDAYGPHAKEANKTLEGSLANTRAALGRIGADFIQPFIVEGGPLVQFFNRLRNIIDNIRKALIPLEGEFIEPVMNGLNKAVTWMVNLDHVTGSTYRRFTNMLSTGDKNGERVKAFNDEVTKSLKSNGVNIDALVDKYGNLGDAIDSLSGSKRSKALYDSFIKIGNVLDKNSDTSVAYHISKFDTALSSITKKYGPITDKNKEAVKALKEEGYSYKVLKDRIKEFGEKGFTEFENYNREQLKSMGLTQDQITLYRQMVVAAQKAGLSIEDYVSNLQLMERHGSGGALILKTIKNSFTALVKPLLAIKDAFFNVFKITNNEPALYNLIYSIEQISEAFIMSDETAKNLTKTFEGLFTVLKWVALLAGGALRAGLFMLSKILHVTGGGLLEITSDISGALNTINTKINDLLNTLGNLIKKNKIVQKSQDIFLSTLGPIGKTLYRITITNNVLGAGLDYISRKFSDFKQHIKTLAAISLELAGWNDFVLEIKRRVSLLGKVFNTLFPNLKHNLELVWGMLNNTTWNDKTFETVIKFIKENIISELSNPDAWRLIGRMIGEGIRVGLYEGFGVVKQAASMFITGLIELIKGILGIHSPSTVMIEIGENVIQGLIVGLESMAGMLIQSISNIVEQVMTTFSGMNFGKYIAFGGSLAIIVMISKLTKSLATILNPLNAVNKLIGAVSDGIDKLSNSIKQTGKAITILMYATAISELAIALYLLSKVSWKKLLTGVLAIGALAAIMVILVKSLSKIEPKEFVIKLDALALFVGTMAALILALSAAFVAISLLSGPQIAKGAIGILAISVAIGLIIYAIGKWGKEIKTIRNGIAVATIMLAFANAMFITASAIAILGMVPESAINSAYVIMGAMLSLILIVTLINKESSKMGSVNNVYDIAAVLMAFGISIRLIASSIKIIGQLSPEELEQGKSVVYKLVGIIGAIVILASILSNSHITKNITKSTTITSSLTGLFIGLGFAMLSFGAAIKILSTISDTDMGRAILAMSGMTAIVAFIIVLADMTSGGLGDVDSIGKLFTGIGVAFISIGIAIKLISEIKPDQLRKAVIAIGFISAFIGGLIVVSRIGKKGLNDGKDLALMFAGISIAILTITASIILLSMVNWTSLAKATAAMAVVMAGIAAILYMAMQVGRSKNAVSAMKMLSVILITLTSGLVILSFLRPEKVLTATLALSTIMVALMGVITLISKMPIKAIPALLMLNIAIGVLGAVLITLSSLPTDNVKTAGIAIVSVLLALSVAMVAAAKLVDVVAKSIIKVMTVMTLIVGALVGLMYIIQKANIQANADVFETLGKMLITMSACMIILIPVGIFAKEAIVGTAALMLFIGEIIGLIVAIGALTEEYPIIKKFLDTGLKMLIRLANGLGQIIGSFIGGAFYALMGGELPGIATSLSDFMNRLRPFIDSVKDLDGDAAKGAKNLAEAVAILSGTAVFNKLATLFTGTTNYLDLGNTFIQLGTAIKEFSDTLGDMDEEDVNRINIASKAVKALVKVADEIPNSGGLAGVFAGENDIKDFAPQLNGLGEAIVTFSNTIAPVSEDNVNKIRLAAKATQELAKINPGNSGGLKQLFTGSINLDKFAGNLEKLGEGLEEFSKSSTNINVELVKNGAKAAQIVVNVCNSLAIEKKDFKAFVQNIDDLGEGLKSFEETTKNLNIESMNAANTEIGKLINTINSMSNLDSGGPQKFRDSMKALGEAGIDDAVEAVNNSKVKLSEAINGLFTGVGEAAKGGDTIDFSYKFTASLETTLGVFNAYSTEFNKAGAKMAKAFSTGFNNSKASLGNGLGMSISKAVQNAKSYTNSMKSAGAAVSRAFSTGFKSSKSNINTTMKNTLDSCKKVVDGYKAKFKTSGGYLVDGFAKGIDNNTYKAVAKARAMAKKAKKAADDALGTKSPSREMIKSGKWFVVGFAKGIQRNIESATNASVLMSTQSMGSVVNAVGSINDMINNGIDPEPSITPVMDTSSISRDMNSVGSALATSYDLGANINVSNNGIDDIAEAIATKVKEAIVSAMDRDDDVNITINSILECEGREIARSSAQYMAPELDKILTRSNRRSGNI